MFKYEGNNIMYDNKCVMRKSKGRWSCDNMSVSIPIDIAVAVFTYHYRNRVYLVNCSGSILAKSLTRTINGELLKVGDQFVYKSGVIHRFQNLPLTYIDVTKNMDTILNILKLRVIPLLCESIGLLTCHYDPVTPCARIFLKGTYVGFIPLL